VWDIYKMVAGSELPTAEAAYVVAAGTPQLWNGTRDCVELSSVALLGRDGQPTDNVAISQP
jgi:hypothetical protein